MNVFWRLLIVLQVVAFCIMLGTLTSLTSYNPDDTNATMS